MRSQRWAWTHTYAVPLFVASVVTVILAGAGLTVVLVFDRTGQRPGGGGDQAQCIVGRWQMTAHRETLPLVGGDLTLDGPGAQVEFRPDGTAVANYGDATHFKTVLLGQPVPVTVTGTIAYRYEVSEGTYRLWAQESEATMTWEFAGTPTSERYSYSDTPVAYECDGDQLQFDYPERNYHAEYRRID